MIYQAHSRVRLNARDSTLRVNRRMGNWVAKTWGDGMNGKGSSRRPATVPEAEQQDRWAATFGQRLAKADVLSDTARHDRDDGRDEPGR